MIMFSLSLIMTALLLPLYSRFLFHIDKVQSNYSGETIPISFGFFIILIESLILLLLNLKEFFYFWGFFIVLIGTYDDYYGESTIKGFKGHFTAFLNKKITSGFIKAVGIGLISGWISFSLSKDIFSMISNFLLLVLMTNTLNLFDLRPGRAIKLYFFLLFMISFYLFPISNSLILIEAGILIVMFFYDIRAKMMLGDSGSNLLGFHLGIWYSLYLPMMGKWIVIILLISIHIYSERFSISQYIDQHRWLRTIDRFGRRGIG